MKRLLCSVLCFVALCAFAVAALPIPVVSYDGATSTLRAEFLGEDMPPFPPAGFARWDVRLAVRGEWVDFYDTHPSREVIVLVDPPLEPGGYFVMILALDADGVVLDSTPLFDFTYAPVPDYRGVLPRVAVGFGWQTSVALTNHISSQPVEVYLDLYTEDGTFVSTVEATIPPHGSKGFYFDMKDFTGSAEIRSTAPLSFVYLAAGPDGLSYSFMGTLGN